MSWHKYKILSLGDKINQIKNGVFPIPSMAVLQINYSCNQNCRSCAFPEWNNKNYVPTEEQATHIMHELMNYGIDTYELCGGGEPTLLPYLESLIRLILSRGFNYSIISNGLAWTDSLIDLAAKTATYVRISVETGDRALYQYYKRVPAWQFDRVVENVRKLVDRKHPDTEISVKFDVDENLSGDKHIKDSYDLAVKLGVDTAIFKGMTGPTESDYLNKVSAGQYLDNLKKDNVSKTTIINAIAYEKAVPQCWLNPLHTLIDGYGDVYLCCYYYSDFGHNKKDHSIGNIYQESFKEIWESPEHWEKIKNIKKENCAKFDCKFFNHHKIVDEVFKRGRLKII